ncbi:MAG: hypothetical protein ACFFAL_11720 [Promethearchaeota archaeon]
MDGSSSSTLVDVHIGESCTIFTVTMGDTVLFGNSEDYRLWGVYAWFMPSQDIYTPQGTRTANGAVFFGFDENGDSADGWPQGGMNDQGLCFDGNGLSYYALNPHYERDSPYAHYLAEILWECVTIDEVIDWYLTHRIGPEMSYQIHFADASGDAVVVSASLDEELAFTRIGTESCLVSTNINVADTSRDVYDCYRYSTAMSMLTAISMEDELTVEACRDVLNAVHQDGTYATKYSNVFDLVNRQIYLWYDRNFDQVAIMNLDDELAMVQPGVDDYYEATALFGAVADEGNIRYRRIALPTLFTPSVPVQLILVAAGIIVLAAVTSITVIVVKRRRV